MGTIVDEIIDMIEEQANNQFNEFARNQLMLVVKKAKEMAEDADEQKIDFETVVKPVLKYLCENHHPHVTVIITPTTAELLEGVKTIGQVFDYVQD